MNRQVFRRGHILKGQEGEPRFLQKFAVVCSYFICCNHANSAYHHTRTYYIKMGQARVPTSPGSSPRPVLLENAITSASQNPAPNSGSRDATSLVKERARNFNNHARWFACNHTPLRHRGREITQFVSYPARMRKG